MRVRLIALLLSAGCAFAQSRTEDIVPVLEAPLQQPEVVAFQIRQYLYQRLPKLTPAHSAAEWTAEAEQLRRHLLDDVIFHGWPRNWVDAPAKFEEVGRIESGDGYRIRKLRYEIVPGFQSTAILYEPERRTGLVPAILNPNGHETKVGKAAEYKQKRCINFAKRGIIALSLEWLGCGELNCLENKHEFGAHLDLVGANTAGLFYLAMRRGLDYLFDYPGVDRARLGVTGLSGGGWQTIVLSALDPRVKVSVPVAGYSAMISKLERVGDYGDNEQVPQDFFAGQDYPHLTAMRAPRPTLIIDNAEDDCCFRAPLVKPYVFDAVKPFFALYGREDALDWYENTDPSTHNYQLNNRLQAYQFFSRHFAMRPIENEIPVDAEIKSYDQLVVGLPQDNLTILKLARKLGTQITREDIPLALPAKSKWAAAERSRLNAVVRYKPATLDHAWALTNSKHRGVETISYQFLFTNGLSATGVSARSIVGADNRPVTIVLNEHGKKASAEEVSNRLNHGDRVLATDLLFTGDAAPNKEELEEFPLLLAATGQRALGIEAAQLIALAQWLKAKRTDTVIRVESAGMRSQLVALVAAGLEPALFAELEIRHGIDSLQYLLKEPVRFEAAPDMFCLDLYKHFDIDRLQVIAEPTRVVRNSDREAR